MHKVSVMTQTPTTCLTCGRGNTPDDPHTMEDFFAIDLERDVNWGDSTYICRYCCDIVAALAGFVSEEQMTDQLRANQQLKEELHETQAELESRNRRLHQITRGTKALKAERKRQTEEAAK